MRKKRGFTLIEILFAIFLVVVCAFIVAATMPIANTSRAKASNLDKAMGLAQKQLEAIRGVGYANITPTQLLSYGLIDSTAPNNNGTYSFTNSDSAALDNPSLILPSGTGSISIQQVQLDLLQVTVTVSWQEHNAYSIHSTGGSRSTGFMSKQFSVGTLIR